jgi:hypothetical protein
MLCCCVTLFERSASLPSKFGAHIIRHRSSLLDGEQQAFHRNAEGATKKPGWFRPH